MTMKHHSLALACAALTLGAVGTSQAAPSAYDIKPHVFKSAAAGSKEAAALSHVVRVKGAQWVRVQFGDVVLSEGSQVRLTSLADGQTQHLTASTLSQWQHTSAFFNGSAVRVELIAAPGIRGDHFAIQSVMAGRAGAPANPTISKVVASANPNAPESVCGADDRKPSALAYSARLSYYTSAALTSDGCMVSAGSAFQDSGWAEVVEFNVPKSDARGFPRAAAVKDQYVISTNSLAVNDANQDWAVFQVLPNSETGLMPDAAQNHAGLPVASAAPAVGAAALVVGYGKNETKRSMSFAQASATGTVQSVDTSTGLMGYNVDTEQGSGGSPVVVNGQIAGVHVYAGCAGAPGGSSRTGLAQDAPPSANLGVMLGTNDQFKAAYQTVCKGAGVERPTCRDFKAASVSCSVDMPGAVEMSATMRSTAFDGQMLRVRIDDMSLQLPIIDGTAFMGVIGSGTGNTHTVTLEDPKGCKGATRTVTCE